MYSSIKNVQLLVSMLKVRQVFNVVISPGGNNISIIHSIEIDNDFTCYSVVDERSAAYFALGLAQQIERPVALVCTSGTAVCNYLPAITEAKYQNVPLVVITSDRSPYLLNQLETQKIDQSNIFSGVCKYEVTLPVIQSEDDVWYCERVLNEAFILMENHGLGPVHINVPTTGNPKEYTCATLPNVKKIEYICLNDKCADLEKFAMKIRECKKILLVFGQNYMSIPTKSIQSFIKKTNCVCVCDYLSNMNIPDSFLYYNVMESIDIIDFEKLLPELVITFGNNMLSNSFKAYMRRYKDSYIHWSVDESFEIRDVFKSINAKFECSIERFFEVFSERLSDYSSLDRSYIDIWKKEVEKTNTSVEEYSEIGAIHILQRFIPDNSVVHTAILNSTRGYHMMKLEDSKNIKSYSNIGALGIDGCMSSFIGHSFGTDSLCFLIIGDLSFFYDMNSLGISGINNNIRIMLLNNGGGAEFHYNMGKEVIPTLNDYISVKHNKSAQGWVESLGFIYLKAEDIESLKTGVEILVNKSDKPIILEVFTDMENDAVITNSVLIRNKTSRSLKADIKNRIKKTLSIK